MSSTIECPFNQGSCLNRTFECGFETATRAAAARPASLVTAYEQLQATEPDGLCTKAVASYITISIPSSPASNLEGVKALAQQFLTEEPDLFSH